MILCQESLLESVRSTLEGQRRCQRVLGDVWHLVLLLLVMKQQVLHHLTFSWLGTGSATSISEQLGQLVVFVIVTIPDIIPNS